MGHVRMMAAAQPFLSGAISKTVNLPNESTVEDIRKIYMQGWKLGLKAIAMYRDGSKGSQPLNSSDKKPKKSEKETKYDEEEIMIKALKGITQRGEKVSLPPKRKGTTYSQTIGGSKIFFRTGEYENGELGEIFIDMYKAGAAWKSLLNSFAIAVSLGLQYGVPLEKFVNKFTFTRFDPSGFTDHPNVRNATSVLDFIFKILAKEYLDIDFSQVPENKMADEPTFTVEENIDKKGEENNLKNSTGRNNQYSGFEIDAPPCDKCGNITIRNGTCHVCRNCGNSMGCS